MKAIWKDQILAESNDTIVVEENHYFPEDAVNEEYLEKSDSKSVCPWKGEAHYYNIKVDGQENLDAAWYYPDPKEKAKNIEGRSAFWKGVEVVE